MKKRKVVLASISVSYDYLLTRHYYKLPSLGIGYIAACLEKDGYEVSIIDRTVSENGIAALADEITGMRPDVVGFYCLSETFKTVVNILKTIKERSPSTVTVMGGPHVYGLPRQGMDCGYLDYEIRGEAEDSFSRLLESDFSPSAFAGIPGLIYKEGGDVKLNPMALIDDLDRLPLPARHLYPPMDRFRPSILAYKRLPATGIITSRGCAHNCIFCHSGKGDFRLRFHSPEYVIDEIKYLKNRVGINELIIFDDTFLINRERALKICEGILREGIDVSWSCNARVNNLDKDLLKTLKKAGCWLIQVGVESGNQDILKTIRKGITLEQAEEACRLAYGEGLEVKAYFILGHPGETVSTLDDTIRFMNKLSVNYVAVNFMTPLPGTELWDTAEKYGKVDKEKLERINYLSDRPAFVPFGLTEELLMDKSREAYLTFYFNPKTVLRFIRALRSPEDLKRVVLGAMILLRLLCSRLSRRKERK